MSTIYKMNDIVPTNVLANRLEQLSDAVCKGPDEVRRKFDMRIPAELDRDADLVLSQSARRMNELEAQLAKVTAERDELRKCLLNITMFDPSCDEHKEGYRMLNQLLPNRWGE